MSILKILECVRIGFGFIVCLDNGRWGDSFKLIVELIVC